MKKITIDEQIQIATQVVDGWPQFVKEVTELKVSAPYYNEPSWRDDSSFEQESRKVENESKMRHC